MIEVEPETVVHGLTVLITGAVFIFVGVAYYRTRLRQLLVLSLLTVLVGLNSVVAFAEEFLEEGVPYFELLTSLFGLGIAVLLLLTIARRFRWQPNNE